jgi:hypothetical protein
MRSRKFCSLRFDHFREIGRARVVDDWFVIGYVTTANRNEFDSVSSVSLLLHKYEKTRQDFQCNEPPRDFSRSFGIVPYEYVLRARVASRIQGCRVIA